ncbi:MAG: hypothetical protein H6696_05500 [Deferribacteres bacterium]|nr:hypothetical protein [candidate division KSB1 bacterium]MCB9501373.1 hypothetical protein [Deferribacteres bacterium]
MPKSKKIQLDQLDMWIIWLLTRNYFTLDHIFRSLSTFGGKTRVTTQIALYSRVSRLKKHGYILYDQILERGAGANRNYLLPTKKAVNLFPELRNEIPGKGMLRIRKQPFQSHSLAISDICVDTMLSTFKAKAKIQELGYIRENYFKITVPFEAKQKRLVKEPDSTWFMQCNGQPHLFFGEVDLSTETVLPSNKKKRNTWENAIIVYSEFRKLVKKGRLEPDNPIHSFGHFKGFRVLVFCKSYRRMRNIMDLAFRMGKEKLFWFVCIEMVKDKNLFFDPIWSLPIPRSAPDKKRALFE